MTAPLRAGLAAVGVVLALAAQAVADTAALSLMPVSGPAGPPQAGQPLRLTVTLTDAVTGQPPRGLSPRFFARPLGLGAPVCEQAARAYRATGSVPAGAVDFGTPLLVTETEDGAIGVADPRLNLQSANMLAAFRPGTPSAGLTPDPDRGRLILAEPDAGQVTAIPVTGGTAEVLLQELDNPRDPVLAEGVLHLATDAGLILWGMEGSQPRTVPMGAGRLHLRDAGGPLAFATGGMIWTDGQSHDLRHPIADATRAGPGTVLTVSGTTPEARLTYLDAPESPVILPLGRAFQRISSDPDGRFALAWTAGEPGFALLDLALGQVVQAGALAQGTLDEVRLTADMAYLLSLNGGFVGAMALNSIRPGVAVALSRVLLGPTDAALPSDPQQRRQLLVPVGRAAQMMAVVPSVQTAFLLDPVMALNGQPPMDGTRLRGGVPVRVVSYDRSFAETASGQFQTTWAFAAGDWELILTTGPGGFSACLPFSVAGERLADSIMPVRLTGAPDRVIAGQSTDLTLRFTDDDGQPVAVGSTEFLVPALGSAWRQTFRASPVADGSLRLRIELPHAGPFALQPLTLPPGLRLRSALVIDATEVP